MPRRGTWTETGGGGFDPAPIVTVAVFVGVVAGIVAVIVALMWWIVSAAAIGGALWLLNQRRIARNKLAITAAFAAQRAREQEVREAKAADAVTAQRRHEIAVAEAGRTVIQNIIDPAVLLAAFGAAVHARPEPEPHAARVVRAQVEK